MLDRNWKSFKELALLKLYLFELLFPNNYDY